MHRVGKLTGIVRQEKEIQIKIPCPPPALASSRTRSLQPRPPVRGSEGWRSSRATALAGAARPALFSLISLILVPGLRSGLVLTAQPRIPPPRTRLMLPTVARRVPIVRNGRLTH